MMLPRKYTQLTRSALPSVSSSRMHQNSSSADRLFVEKPEYNEKQVAVLQVLLTHDEWFLVELVEKSEL